MTDFKPHHIEFNRSPYSTNDDWKKYLLPQNCKTFKYSKVHMYSRKVIFNLKYLSFRERLKILSFLGENIGTLPFPQRDPEILAKIFPSYGNHNIFSLLSLRRNLGSSEIISILPVSTQSFKIELLPKNSGKQLWIKRKGRMTEKSETCSIMMCRTREPDRSKTLKKAVLFCVLVCFFFNKISNPHCVSV